MNAAPVFPEIPGRRGQTSRFVTKITQKISRFKNQRTINFPDEFNVPKFIVMLPQSFGVISDIADEWSVPNFGQTNPDVQLT